jgi:hypothetical protein
MEKELRTQAYTDRKPCEGAGRRRRKASRENNTDTLIWNFWPPKCEEVNICCLNYSICGTLF